jgi:hypothetical protein
VDQTRFDFPLDDLKRKRRRRGKRPKRKAAPAPPPAPALLESPLVQRCGFCGHDQTVLGESALCDECGGIIIRDEAGE